MNWLFKEEPSNYSYDDLVRDGKTSWTGVRNPVAQRNLRSVKKGEKIFFYHTGKEKAIVGEMRAVGAANGRNPISIITPCHRVLGSNGKLTGFAGGLEAKDHLLKHEGRDPLLGLAARKEQNQSRWLMQ